MGEEGGGTAMCKRGQSEGNKGTIKVFWTRREKTVPRRGKRDKKPNSSPRRKHIENI
jgi:hypothetical protein